MCLHKALDIWLITCFVYTLTVLFEYCIVLHLSREASDNNKINNKDGDGKESKRKVSSKWQGTTDEYDEKIRKR
jgi:hypothetical protein